MSKHWELLWQHCYDRFHIVVQKAVASDYKKGLFIIKMRMDLIIHNEFVAVWEKCVSLEGHLIYWCPFVTLLNVDRRLCTPLRLLSTCGTPDVLYGHIWKTQPMIDLKLDHNCFWLVEIHSACQKWHCSESKLLNKSKIYALLVVHVSWCNYFSVQNCMSLGHSWVCQLCYLT